MPSANLPSADYDDLLERAGRRRARRRTTLLAASGPAAVAALALLLSSPGGGGEAALLTDGTPYAADPSEEPAPSPSPGDSSALPLPGLSELPWPLRPSPTRSPKPMPSESESEPESEHGRPKPKPSPVWPDRPAEYAYLAGEAPDGCTSPTRGYGSADVQNWCTRYSGATSFVSGDHDGSLIWDICRASTATAGTLTRYGDRWLKVGVWSEDEPDTWSWYGEAPPAAPTIVVDAGDCVRWIVPFDVFDDSGAPMEPGDYQAKAAFVTVNEYPVEDVRITITRTEHP